jgi:phenylpropionate dioxygenase-like ring-hydroxylating dioxygenase large terminal subunit
VADTLKAMNGFVAFERSDMETVAELLAADSLPVPEPLLEHCPSTLGPADVSTDRYTSQEIHELEVERVWKKVWQWACREEELVNIGDYYVYDVANLSVLVVRTALGSAPGAIRAYQNVCLHRGTQLAVEAGNVPVFRCPFHGWTWNIDGSLNWVPCEWDFPAVQKDRASFSLPEVQVGLWGGFVFINFDANCESLESYLENIPDHFTHYPLDNRFIAINVRRVMPANWKVTMGAFIEAYHSVVTHPQILPFTGDANTQYDIYNRHSRMITPFAVASPHIGGKNYEQVEILRTVTRHRGGNAEEITLPEGARARPAAAAAARQRISAIAGADLSKVCDSLMVDAIEYFIFPNFMPWAAYGSPIQYRFRPNGDDVNSAIMDVVMLMPFDGDRPPPAPVHHIGVDEKWTTAPQLGGLGAIFEQDTSNLARVQKGLRTGSKKTVTLGDYQEARIRHFHKVLDEYIARA